MGALKLGRWVLVVATLHTSGMSSGSLSIVNAWGAPSYIFFTFSFRRRSSLRKSCSWKQHKTG
jgi:hypothetical protein